MVDIDDLTESELDVLHKYYVRLSDIAEQDEDIHKSHSIDSAKAIAKEKKSEIKRNKKD